MNPFLTSLRQATRRGRLPLIAEIKPSTPEHGDMLRGRPVEEIVRAYEDAGAACVSVVTGRWFGGSLALLERVRQATKLPILHKDFIATAPALARSRAMGASAVLLTRTLITREALLRLVDNALALGLTPFVELASAIELVDLRLPPQAVAAVNNKDIASKETTGDGVSRSFKLLPLARRTGAGAVVSASGIDSAASARALVDAGYDGLLVGSALLRADDLTRALSELRVALTPAEACAASA